MRQNNELLGNFSDNSLEKNVAANEQKIPLLKAKNLLILKVMEKQKKHSCSFFKQNTFPVKHPSSVKCVFHDTCSLLIIRRRFLDYLQESSRFQNGKDFNDMFELQKTKRLKAETHFSCRSCQKAF